MALREGDDADRCGHPAFEDKTSGCLLEPAELGRAAADIDDQHRFGPIVEKVDAALNRQPGFFDRVDDAQAKPRSLADAFDKGGAIVRLPTGLGGDGHQARRLDALLRHALPAEDQRVIRPLHGPLIETPGARQAFPQPNDAAERIDNPKSVPRRAGDQQAAVIGPKIERPVQRRLSS